MRDGGIKRVRFVKRDNRHGTPPPFGVAPISLRNDQACPRGPMKGRKMKVGYARVSTEDQRLDLQLTALKRAGCSHIFKDHGISGAEMSRPGLEKMLRALRPGQTLVVWRLDRLGRSLAGLVQLVDELGRRGIGFQSITEEVNTTTSGGRLIFHIMAALAEFERTLISERTKAGMQEALNKGRHVGRPPSLTDQDVLKAMHDLESESVAAIARRHGISPRTLQRRMQKFNESKRLEMTDCTASRSV